jgi:DNA-binding response OmpR family regulator
MRERMALEAFENLTYDVLVLDVMMPILDGF